MAYAGEQDPQRRTVLQLCAFEIKEGAQGRLEKARRKLDYRTVKVCALLKANTPFKGHDF